LPKSSIEKTQNAGAGFPEYTVVFLRNNCADHEDFAGADSR